MPIVGINIKSVEARIKDGGTGNDINITSTPVIDNVKKYELKILGLKDVVSFEFTFSTKYSPDVGEINIKGEVIYHVEDAERTISMWKENKLDPKIGVEIMNAIFRKCLSKAVSLADELRLPPPLTFPVVKSEPVNKDSI